jgi:homoaconitate hydratase
MSTTLVHKIVARHAVGGAAAVRSGAYVRVRPRHVMTHDNTAAVLDKYAQLGAPALACAEQPIFALDHNVQDVSASNQAKYARIGAFAAARGVRFFGAGRGIGHQVMCEEGFAWPGSMVVASDSHANMYGGLGCLGTPVVRTDAAAIWATAHTWWQVPPVSRVLLEGPLPPSVSGKDVIVALCAAFARDEVLNHAVEFRLVDGAVLSVDDRLTIANMTTEFGCLAGLFEPDHLTLDWLRAAGVPAARLAALADELPSLRPDADARYARTLRLSLPSLSPHVSGPNSVKVARPLAHFAANRVDVQKAYLLSCVNGRAVDLRRAAAVFAGGRRVHPSVQFYVAAASDREQRIAGDAFDTLVRAGARPLPPGCGPCIGLGAGLLEKGDVGISATNRNFKGRMGHPDAACYLASPEVVAASAIAGHICGPHAGGAAALEFSLAEDAEVLLASQRSSGGGGVALIDGFPPLVAGAAVACLDDNINTDGIYAGKYTYDESVTGEMQARVAFENYDPHFARVAQRGDVVIAGFNFGTGSSREQAATCLKHFGAPLLIAGSFNETYKRNALNNGVIAVECEPLVRALQAARERGAKTWRLPLPLRVDFRRATIEYDGAEYAFGVPGEVAQQLVVRGGLEAVIAAELNEKRE